MTATRIVLIEVAAIGLLSLAVVSGVSLPAPVPLAWHLLLHEVSAMLLVGNIAGGALMLVLADKAGSPEVFRFASRGVMWADAVFTGPSAWLLLYNGAVIAEPYGGPWATTWLQVGMAGFLVSGAVWLGLLLPIQARLISLADRGARGSWVRLARIYGIPGAIAGLALLTAVGAMVLKSS